MDDDWDTLILLDGLRFDYYDTLQEEILESGDPGKIISPASASPEYIRTNFCGQSLHDTIYVTANPYVHLLDSDVFYKVFDVVNSNEFWDNEYRTVMPQTMVDIATEVHNTHPNKRIIVHFMQPHHPFVGESRSKLPINRGIIGDRDVEDIQGDLYGHFMRQWDPDVELLREAYKENARIALQSANDLISNIEDGTIAISADHGNLLGERMNPIPAKGFGHPIRAHLPLLVEVPWHTVQKGDRPTRKAEPESETPRKEDVESRLEALGYR